MASSTLSNYTHLHDKCVCEMCNCGIFAFTQENTIAPSLISREIFTLLTKSTTLSMREEAPHNRLRKTLSTNPHTITKTKYLPTISQSSFPNKGLESQPQCLKGMGRVQ